MAEKVAKVGVKKAKGYLYFVDKKGNVGRAKMSRGGRKKGKAKVELVAKVGVKKKTGYLYCWKKWAWNTKELIKFRLRVLQ